ncbi:MAG: hypothetical protein K0B09_08070 [Bacteroidales bacterium]|nr:hypothetical protein [Bacteroidales bacterium]
MNFSDFYIVLDKDTRGSLNLIPKLKQEIDINQVFRNELMPDKVIEFFPNYGTQAFDFLNSGYAGVFLISRFIFDLLTTNKISGWKAIPARILGYESLEYFLLTIKGRCSAIDYDKSESFIKPPFTPTGKPFEAKRGLFFDLNSWDGSDIFTPDNSRMIFVTEKVKKILIKSKATNILVESIIKHVII